VAISIPISISQLEKSHDAVLRAAYSEAQSTFITEDTISNKAKYTQLQGLLPLQQSQQSLYLMLNQSKGQKAPLDNITQFPFEVLD